MTRPQRKRTVRLGNHAPTQPLSNATGNSGETGIMPAISMNGYMACTDIGSERV